MVSHEHSESASHDHETGEAHGDVEHGEDHDAEHDQVPGHSHGTYSNELFVVMGTKALPYVTPSLLFVCDLNNTPGSYLQMRIDAAIPIVRRIFILEPFVLLGLNLGYNTTAYYGWNHFQFGLKANWEVSRYIAVYGGISYSVGMTALREIDQGNEVWASVGVIFSY